MHSPWKLATLGLVALGAVVGTSSLTTAYLMRPPAIAPAITPPVLTQAPERRPPIVRVAPTPPRKAVTPASPSVVSAVVETAATAAQERAPMTAPEAAPVDCDTGGDRALRIAKPGALGAVLGAGLGAAGGAIANGGKGAGQGALIGGLAGAVLGAGYGAYKTQNECGTILGDDRSDGGGRIVPATGSRAPHEDAREDAMAPLQSTRPGNDRIHIYDAR